MQTTTPSENLKRRLEEGSCQLVDVREPVENAEESIPQARLIPLGELEKRAHELDRTRPLVVHCQSGKRGSQAVEKLRALGFTDVQNLEGGIQAWKEKGLAVHRSSRGGLPLMQQVQLTIGLGVLTGVLLSRYVNPQWIWLSAFFGAGLVMAGLTGWCGLAILLSKMPWNQVAGGQGGGEKSCCPPR